MRERLPASLTALGVFLAVGLFTPTFMAAQSSDGAARANASAAAKTNTFVIPRMADGHPDFGGYWNMLSFTPLERPAKYGNREFLTAKEMEDVFESGVRGSYDPGAPGSEDRFGGELFNPDSADYDAVTYGLSPWQNGVKPNPRTSLIVDPLDGRIPPLTPKADAEAKARARAAEGRTPSYNTARDLGQNTTCVFQSGGPPLIPAQYNAGLLIVQNPGYMLIQTETGSQFRIIPLNGSPHLSPKIRKWHGDSRGHWEGDTLVVETTNFRPDRIFRNGDPNTQKITEYFKRMDADTIEYKFTVNDPSTWTKPWSAIIPMNATTGPIFEASCSENNYAAVNILAGARRAEREAKAPVSQK
jgi:hypothetical protein